MNFLVAYNGSPLAEKAVTHARQFSDEGDDVVVVTVVPRHPKDAEEALEFTATDHDAVAKEAEDSVHELHPEASFVDVDIGRPVSAGRVGHRVREVAHEQGADVVLVGSMKAGRIVSTISSPATQIVTDTGYDVVVVRDHEG